MSSIRTRQGDTAAAAVIEPLLTKKSLAGLLAITVREVERMRAAGRLPQPDLHIGRLPRWRPETIRLWIDEQAEGRRARA